MLPKPSSKMQSKTASKAGAKLSSAKSNKTLSVESLAVSHVPDIKFAELAQRIAGLRDACGFTVAEFADKLGLEQSVYAEYEKTGVDVPASLLFHIGHICGVDMAEIMTGGKSKLDTYQVIRNGHGKVIDRYQGYHVEDLAFNFGHKSMQPMLVTLDPNQPQHKFQTHQGQEFNYVVEGTVILVFESEEIVLERGDAVYFNPGQPHAQKCGSKEAATFIAVITEVA